MSIEITNFSFFWAACFTNEEWITNSFDNYIIMNLITNLKPNQCSWYNTTEEDNVEAKTGLIHNA